MKDILQTKTEKIVLKLDEFFTELCKHLPPMQFYERQELKDSLLEFVKDTAEYEFYKAIAETKRTESLSRDELLREIFEMLGDNDE